MLERRDPGLAGPLISFRSPAPGRVRSRAAASSERLGRAHARLRHLLWRAVAGAAAGLLLLWMGLLLVLWRVKPDDSRLRDALRVLPDVLRLWTRLARDASLPRGLRFRLWLLLACLAAPVDLVPDFIPVVGYADDAVLVVWTLRSIARLAGAGAIEKHRPGTPEGLQTIVRLVGLDAREVAQTPRLLRGGCAHLLVVPANGNPDLVVAPRRPRSHAGFARHLALVQQCPAPRFWVATGAGGLDMLL